jgi:hypothetical protein
VSNFSGVGHYISCIVTKFWLILETYFSGSFGQKAWMRKIQVAYKADNFTAIFEPIV